MGDSKSWAADQEDEDKTCCHGEVTKYFDTCQCPGCKQDRVVSNELSLMANRLRAAALDALRSEQPDRRQWRFDFYMRLINGGTNEH